MVVFMSYQRADTAFAALALSYGLRAHGHEVFFDTGSIAAGASFRQVITQAMARSNLVLAMIGPDFDVPRLQEPTNVVAFEWQRAQFHGMAVVPVLVDGARMPTAQALPPTLRWITRRNALALQRASSMADVQAIAEAVPALARSPQATARVLWVDDRPANNEVERRLLRPHGIVFDNVVSTAEALEQLAGEAYDLVITDLGRRGSSDRSSTAGASFLEQPVVRSGPPVIVYAGAWVTAKRADLIARGAMAVMASRPQLIDTVLQLLGRARDAALDEAAGELQR